MPISIEEFEKLPDSRFSPLVEYIRKRFGSKSVFLSFLAKEGGIEFKARPYDQLMKNVFVQIGKPKLFSLLGIKDEKEAELRAYLFDALYKGLTETVWARHLSPIYEKVIGKKIKIVRKIDKRDPAYVLAFNADEKVFTRAWVDLYKNGDLPVVFHYGKITVGALGWLKAHYKRGEGYYSTVFDIIDNKFVQSSRQNIYGSLLNLLEQIGKKPDKFEIPEELANQLVNNLKLLAVEKNDILRSMMSLQLIETYINDNNLCEVINQLIAEEYIEPPEIRRLYERYPYSFSSWIVTPYGIFKQPSSWLSDPNKRLSELLQKEIDQKYLEPDLESYHGSYPLRVLAYCIRENPEKILGKFGYLLRKIAEDLGISAALNIKEEEKLIRLIILKLGFNLPPILSGLVDFNQTMDNCASRLRKGEHVTGVMADVYGEIERLLQDISYFYIGFLWKLRTRARNPEEVETEFTNIIRELNVSNKSFLRLTFGEMIKLLRTLNKETRKNRDFKDRLIKTFNLTNILPQDQMKILNEMSKYRTSLFAHKRINVETKIPSRNTCQKIITSLKNFSNFIEENQIYPQVIRVTFQVTTEYGTQYFEAVDDKGDIWTVKYRWLDPSKPYFMYSKTHPVAVDPIIIEKIF